MARRNRGNATPRGGRNSRGRGGSRGRGRSASALNPAAPAFTAFNPAAAAFTLAEEARQTRGHDISFSTKLRQKPVAFVSAGMSEPLKILDDILEEKKQTLEDTIEDEPQTQEEGADVQQADIPNVDKDPTPSPAIATSLRIDNEEQDEGEGEDEDEGEVIGPDELEMELQAKDTSSKNSSDEPKFFFDLKGEPSATKKRNEPIHIPDRSLSRSSTSSDEVILFKGRSAMRQAKIDAINMTQIQAELKIMEKEIQVIAPAPELVLETRSKGRVRPRRQRKRQKAKVDDEEAAIIADYIENMRNNGEADDFLQQRTLNRRDLGGADDDVVVSSSSEKGDEPDEEVEEVNRDSDEEAPIEEDENHESESELDDATLAKLIAGHRLDLGDSSDSDSSDEEGRGKRQLTEDDDFDLMDWERPSLRRRKGKGAQAEIKFDVSDSDLERALQIARKSDRMKKAERKRQREELRALGLLGKKAKENPDDLEIKYPWGISMEEVSSELRDFLLSSRETLSFPPMDPHARKIVHDLAHKFKLKSKSTGKEKNRRPVLYRTKRTLAYSDAVFDEAVGRIKRRYLPRLDVKGKRAERPPPPRSGNAEATYRDGEVIGAAAPELSVENRGRAMLEKMGWSKGTALGAVHNKGILQPVTQTMKRSKAGLG